MRKANIIASREDIKELNKWKLDYQKSAVYKPFLSVRDVRQVGRRHWQMCPVQKRNTHLLSDGEYRAYRKLMLAHNCIEVLEQYPLDLDETLDIAVALNLIHPRNYKTNIAYIMTTDFLVTYMSGSGTKYQIAYTFKYFDVIYDEDEHGNVETKDARTWQKFEIERHYWLRRNVGYQVITERDATKAESWNYNYFLQAVDLDTSAEELREFCIAFIDVWLCSPRAELQLHFRQLESNLNQSYQRIQALFQHACLRKLLPIDTKKFIRVFRPVGLHL